jgi:hypothetical protein
MKCSKVKKKKKKKKMLSLLYKSVSISNLSVNQIFVGFVLNHGKNTVVQLVDISNVTVTKHQIN